jgi:hypothetical protein
MVDIGRLSVSACQPCLPQTGFRNKSAQPTRPPGNALGHPTLPYNLNAIPADSSSYTDADFTQFANQVATSKDTLADRLAGCIEYRIFLDQ